MIDPCRSNEEGKIYVHNLIKLKINVKMDLTGITDLKLEVKKPSRKRRKNGVAPEIRPVNLAR